MNGKHGGWRMEDGTRRMAARLHLLFFVLPLRSYRRFR